MNLTGILLAAGSGSRFGGDKLLAVLPDGTPLAVAAVRALHAVLPEVIAVVRPGDTRLAAVLAAEGVRVIECPNAATGMGASLAWGVKHAPAAEGWVVGLGDMPFVQPQTVAMVAAVLAAGAALAAPVYQGRRGHPVGFTAAYRAALAALSADAGARDILTDAGAALTLIEVDDPGLLRDVDVPADLGGARR
ncbi:MAG: nucleotidyltransferase family protein [Burkholderiales bacterium]